MDRFVYKNFSIDFNSRLISQNGAELPLDPKAFNTLALLIENKDRIVSNDELIEQVWDDRPTNNEVVTASIGRVRKVFKDAGIKSEVIRTAHKVGYQFILEEKASESANIEAATTQVSANRHRLQLLVRLNLALMMCLIIVGALLTNRFWDLRAQNVANSTTDIETTQGDSLANTPLTKSKPTEIFFIRHAEKESDGTDDPPLSALGIARATRWRNLFEGIKFDEVYTTRFIRNTQTVDHVFGENITNLKYYSALSFDIAIESEKFAGKKIAIIGHSNTIPGMVNRLVTDHQYDAMDHRNYELIYQVTIDSSGGVVANQLKLDYIIDGQ